jgi:hypothetical protein
MAHGRVGMKICIQEENTAEKEKGKRTAAFLTHIA